MAENQMAVLSFATLSFGGLKLSKKAPTKICRGFLFSRYKILMSGDAIFCKSVQTRRHRQSAPPAFSASR
jgi:hypothetical protein